MSKQRKLDPTNVTLAIQYRETLSRPEVWIAKAEELLAAAHILEPEVVKLWEAYTANQDEPGQVPVPRNVQGPYFLLIAYAIENYCKAELIQQNIDELRNRLLTDLPEYLKGHNLVQLVRNMGLQIDLQEEDLLARLYRNSLWAARYPVPMEPDGMQAIRQFSDGRWYLTAYFVGSDVQRINLLVDRLKKHVSELSGNVPQ